MERLTEKVYQCNLAVEAHMVCDLLSQAGISARVDGEFLQGAAGEIPLGNTVKVRVDPSRAAEAREVIADWEKLQPAETPAPPARKSTGINAVLWFVGGSIVGAALMFLRFDRMQATQAEFDRNHDGRIDARWMFDWSGKLAAYEEDNDFDGRFEWQCEVEAAGFIKRGVLDRDGDGRPEQETHSVNGVPVSSDFYGASGGRVVKRDFYKAGLLDHAEYDDDGDGRFERRVEYDDKGDPKL
jgi:hypothetical protein